MAYQTEKTNNSRIQFIDALKGLAILSVVYIHNVFPETAGSRYILSVKIITAFHMFLFFALSGYFYRPEKRQPFNELVRQKAYSLLLPYVIWGIVFGFLITKLHDILSSSLSFQGLKATLIALALGRESYLAAWFLLVLFLVYFIEYFLTRLQNTFFENDKHHIFLLTANLAFTVLGFFICYRYNNRFFSIFRIKLVLVSCFFYYFGYFINRIFQSDKLRILRHPAAGVLYIIAGVSFSLLNKKVTFSGGEFGNPLLATLSASLTIFGLFCIFSAFEKYSNTKAMKSLVFMGKNSIIILLTHRIIIYSIRVLEQLLHMQEHSFNPILAFLIICVLEIPVILFSNRFIPFLFGKKSQKMRPRL